MSIEYPHLDNSVIVTGFIKIELVNQTVLADDKAGDFYEKTFKMVDQGGIDVNYKVELVQFL